MKKYSLVYFDITGYCNAHCIYCHSGANRVDDEKNQISPENFDSGLEKLYHNGFLEKEQPLNLFGWGEPFLHKKLPEIIEILNRREQHFAFSTNASVVPAIDAAWCRNLDRICFSLSGFTEESYGKIHRLNLDKVKQNIVSIVNTVRQYNHSCEFQMLFHVYRFNAKDFFPAWRFCRKNRICFNPYMAILNHWHMVKAYFTHQMPQAEINEISTHITLPPPEDFMRNTPPDYVCPQSKILYVDEKCNVVTCCQIARNVQGYSCGNLLTEPMAMILKNRKEQLACRSCIASGMALYFNTASGRYRILPLKIFTALAKLKKIGYYFFTLRGWKALKAKIGRDAGFSPPWYGVFFNPFYLTRKELGKHIRKFSSHIRGRVLDVGCGTKPYQTLFACEEYIGLELDTPENRKNKTADIFYDGKTFPFEDSSFDSIIINQVLEHVFNPDIFLNEVSRVLKPGGILLLTVPFVWDEHEQPWDFCRYSSFGLKSLLQNHMLQIKNMEKSTTGMRLLAQLINNMIYKKIIAANRYCYYLLLLLLVSPINVIGVIFGNIFSCNQDLFLDNVVLAVNIKPENKTHIKGENESV